MVYGIVVFMQEQPQIQQLRKYYGISKTPAILFLCRPGCLKHVDQNDDQLTSVEINQK
jgi:hypothetical protein